jgi:hypothetical protein
MDPKRLNTIIAIMFLFSLVGVIVAGYIRYKYGVPTSLEERQSVKWLQLDGIMNFSGGVTLLIWGIGALFVGIMLPRISGKWSIRNILGIFYGILLIPSLV